MLNRGAFSTLRRRDFRCYFAGHAVSLIGTSLQMTTVSWLVFETTASSRALGSFYFLSALPFLPIVFAGGLVADRIRMRTLLIATTGMAAAQAGTLAVLSISDRLSLGLIAALYILLAVVTAFEAGARLAFTTALVGVGSLGDAVALLTAAWSVAMILGPAMAAFLLTRIGAGGCFLVNLLASLAGLLSLLSISSATERERPPMNRTPRELGAGVVAIRRSRTASAIFALVVTSSLLCFSSLTLLPAFATQVFARGTSAYGILAASLGLGSAVGALAYSYARTRRGVLFVLTRILAPITLICFCIAPDYRSSCGLLALSGALLVSQNSLGDPLIQTLAPPHLRGRVMSLFSLGSIGTMRLGGVVLGALADQVGPSLALGASSFACLVVSAGIVLWVPEVLETG